MMIISILYVKHIAKAIRFLSKQMPKTFGGTV